MKHLLVFAFAAAGAASLAAAAIAQQIDSTPFPMNPKPDLSSMQFIVGTWHCSSKSARRPTPTLATQTTTMDATGYWLVTKTKSQATSWNPHPAESVDQITYDVQNKRWVDVYTDNQGGYDISSSTGWNGNTMTWRDLTPSVTGDITSTSATKFTKVGDTKTTSSNTFTTKKGRTVGVTGSCSKA